MAKTQRLNLQTDALQPGTVKWFNDKRGYGFVVAQDGGPDVLVHHAVIQMPGRRTLCEGEAVLYEDVAGPLGLRATRVVRCCDVPPSL